MIRVAQASPVQRQRGTSGADLETFTETLSSIGCDHLRDDPTGKDLLEFRDATVFASARTVVVVNRVAFIFDAAGRYLGSWNDQWPRGIVRRGRGL